MEVLFGKLIFHSLEELQDMWKDSQGKFEATDRDICVSKICSRYFLFLEQWSGLMRFIEVFLEDKVEQLQFSSHNQIFACENIKFL